jgi:cell division septum initiation protein DivIVA
MTRVPPSHQEINAHAPLTIMETVVNSDLKTERGKVKVHRSAVGSATVAVQVTKAPDSTPAPPLPGTPAASTMMSPDEALQVLALAQRTAENHVTAANRHAQQVRAEAEAAAEQIRLEAHSYAEKVRAEAEKLRDDARAAAEARSRDAEAQAAEIRRQAATMLSDARTEAEQIVAEGHDRAGQLDLRAKQRYEDAVGSLAIKRAALQKQIEALATFDSDYRHRLASFMHIQLRALWIEQPGITEALDIEVQLPGGPVGAAEPS